MMLAPPAVARHPGGILARHPTSRGRVFTDPLERDERRRGKHSPTGGFGPSGTSGGCTRSRDQHSLVLGHDLELVRQQVVEQGQVAGVAEGVAIDHEVLHLGRVVEVFTLDTPVDVAPRNRELVDLLPVGHVGVGVVVDARGRARRHQLHRARLHRDARVGGDRPGVRRGTGVSTGRSPTRSSRPAAAASTTPTINQRRRQPLRCRFEIHADRLDRGDRAARDDDGRVVVPVVACVRERRHDVDEDRRARDREGAEVEKRNEGPRREDPPVPGPPVAAAWPTARSRPDAAPS